MSVMSAVSLEYFYRDVSLRNRQVSYRSYNESFGHKSALSVLFYLFSQRVHETRFPVLVCSRSSIL